MIFAGEDDNYSDDVSSALLLPSGVFCGVAVVLTLVLRQQDAGAPAERERLHAS